MKVSMPTFFHHRPAGLLGRYVESFWYRPATALGADTGMLVLPGGRAEFVISLDGAPQTSWTDLERGGLRSKLHHATVRLPNCAPVATALSGRGGAFGVALKPHGLRRFTRADLGNVESGMAALEQVWGSRADELVERLAEAPTPASKFALMETLLWNRLYEPHRAYRQVERAAALLSDPFAVRSVDSVAGEVGLSPRRLLDVFRQDVGLTPKTFARVMRFGAALRLVRATGPTRWTDVAAMCNYFDQAHLVREFRVLAGMAPTTYIERRTAGHANCLPWDPPKVTDLSRLDDREHRVPAFT
ncbi:MAG: helix-turn-helix transcriptional regulator [Burkholderiales bacterium]|nr:helix-turn-helix transcriptional regulator [Burkholderiales bacterium]